MLSLVIGQSGCAPRETGGTSEGSRSEVRGFRNFEPERRTSDRAFRARPAFPALLARMSRDAILANDHQAHNATAVSDAGRPVHLVDLVHLVYLVGLVQPNKRDRPDRPNRPNEQDMPTFFFYSLLQYKNECADIYVATGIAATILKITC